MAVVRRPAAPDASGGRPAADRSSATGSEDARERLLDLLALERFPRVGPARVRALLEEFGSARGALEAASRELPHPQGDRARTEALHALRALESLAHRQPELRPRLWGLGDPAYPERLLDLPHPPPVLFSFGDTALLERPCVAIVGTRRATRYGERIARGLSASLAQAGACVVSGLAQGVDGVAHAAALEVSGATAAVLGTGIDVAYPRSHHALHHEIARRGVVLSEHPPGERAGPGAFPRRNRIIAALAEVTIVVEAGVRSGALLTAAHALELGRVVAAVPGPIDAAESAGTNALLRDGAQVIADVTDALALLGLAAPPRRARPELSTDARITWDALGSDSVRLEDLPARAGLPLERCLAAVTELELAGAVVCELTGEVARRI